MTRNAFGMAIFALIVAAQSTVSATGHGPVFGGATPVLGRNGWQFDQAWMGRRDRTGDDDQMLRSMIGYGITEDLQISASLPIQLATSRTQPLGRMTAMMSGSKDLEALVGWRVHRRTVGEGARFETTVYAGGALPLESRRAGIRTAPSAYLAAASGYASRAHYFWLGGSYNRPLDDDGDRIGDVKSLSVVYGYRPPALRLDYPKPDLRFFVEALGEITGRSRHHGVPMADSGGRAILVGPTTLLLYKEYGVSGGVLFPAYQRTNGAQPKERLRFGLNFSYFFWL